MNKKPKPNTMDDLGTFKVTRIEFAFDDRHLPDDIGVPSDSKHGVVMMKFSDNTAISQSCTRGKLEDTLAYCFNQKLTAKLKEVDRWVSLE